MNSKETALPIEKQQIKISVRKIVEFVFRYGDLQIGSSDKVSMQDGTKAHRKLQKNAGEGYDAEVRLSYTKAYDEFNVCVSGICDGIIAGEGSVMIDEIKTTLTPADEIEEDFEKLHWYQAMCYAFMYNAEHGNRYKTVDVRLTYYNMETEQIKYFHRFYSIQELEDFFFTMLDRYYRWAEFSFYHYNRRKISSEKLSFPFGNFRKGQREFAGRCYIAFKYSKKLFAQAPTGTGKTMSTLFPAIKGFAEDFSEKIFYLTAKTVTRNYAKNSFQILRDNGLEANCIVLTAKDKLCPYGSCDFSNCRFAAGHFDRINDAVYDIIKNEDIVTPEKATEYSEKHNVCPFEFLLDISNWCDVIVCDYNHTFDPSAKLRRYFDEGGNYILLVDEAHNLVERGRDMFSVTLSERNIKAATKCLKNIPFLKRIFIKTLNIFSNYNDFIKEPQTVMKPDAKLYNSINDFCMAYSEKAYDETELTEPELLLDIFFEFSSFIYLYDNFDDTHFVYYIEKTENDTLAHIFCVDPSEMLNRTASKCRSSIFFSATLMPTDYYKTLLGGREEDKDIYIPSPFPRENLCLLIAKDISARYKNRQNSYEDVAYYIYNAIKQKTGNYIAFFPSFAYLNAVYEVFCQNFPGFNVQKQENILSEDERQNFITAFESHITKGLLSFAVMGGIFSEGIDFLGDLLSGVFIVSVGLPQICFERDIIKNLFENRFRIEALNSYQMNQSKNAEADEFILPAGSDILNLKTDNINVKNDLSEFSKRGFDFAYKYPGFNRVLQAAGRVIRSETDKGFIMLLDERFSYREYRRLFPPEWAFPKILNNAQEGGKIIKNFWDNRVN